MIIRAKLLRIKLEPYIVDLKEDYCRSWGPQVAVMWSGVDKHASKFNHVQISERVIGASRKIDNAWNID